MKLIYLMNEMKLNVLIEIKLYIYEFILWRFYISMHFNCYG